MNSTPGYAGNILRVNLSSQRMETIPTRIYADRFIGGRGIAAKIHWEEVDPDIHAFDPDNRLVFMTGPVCGIPGFAGSRWMVSGKSPLLNQFSYCNLGGSWGAQLKFAGFDGIIIHGEAPSPVYLRIDNDRVEIKDAAHLKGKGAITTREMLKNDVGTSFHVVAIGQAGENRVIFASLLADADSSGSGGLGAVMGAKNLKAIVVRGNQKIEVAHKDRVSELRRKLRKMKDPVMPIVSSYPEAVQKSVCFGCIDGCSRSNYTDKNGRVGKSLCHSGVFYTVRAYRFYQKKTEVPFLATKLCDDYGMDSYPVDMAMKWLIRCQKSGIISDEEVEIPISKVGSQEFIETLTKKIAFREGLGDLLANGIRNAAAQMGEKYTAAITDYLGKTDTMQVYDPRLYLTTSIFWAMEPRLPIQQLHEIIRPILTWVAGVSEINAKGSSASDNYMTSDVIRRIGKTFWGSEIAADFSTYEGKSKAAFNIQNRHYLNESAILCDMSHPIIYGKNIDSHVADPTLTHHILSAITGINADRENMEHVSQRIFTIQRAGQIKDGHRGSASDVLEPFHFTIGLKRDFANEKCIVPGKNGEVFSRKGSILDKNEFENMKSEYYGIRGWDLKTGLPTRKSLECLELKEVADGLEEIDMLGKAAP